MVGQSGRYCTLYRYTIISNAGNEKSNCLNVLIKNAVGNKYLYESNCYFFVESMQETGINYYTGTIYASWTIDCT